ncbi:MAG: TrmH family RNA methyltransferase [Oscillospiraceae bacterium]
MNAEIITSRQNPLMTHLRKLASSRSYRKKSGEYLCDGTKLLAEALKWGAEVKTAVFSEGVDIPPLPDGVRAVRVSEELMRSVSPMETPQGALFTVALPEVQLPETLSGKHYLVLDGVQDPGNVGTILRTADAFDCDGVFLVNACADLYNPKTARATMGAIFRREAYTVTAEELFALLRKSGVPLYGTALRDDTVPLAEANLARAAVAIGSEGRGLSQQVLDECAKTLKIPMNPRCESLNAAIAATVVLWEMYR